MTLVHDRLSGFARALRDRVVWAHRRRVGPQSGFALLIVTVAVAILGAVVGEFGYNARVELESAANARDQLRAEYLARSGINLSRLLIKVQQNVLDTMNRQLRTDIQIADFAPFLVKAFGGEEGGAELGGLLGIDPSSVKGLGVGKGASFDVAMGTEDGKININCGGGLNAGGGGQLPGLAPPPIGGGPAVVVTNPKQALFALLTGLVYPRRYDRLFETADADGQFTTRAELVPALIDWSDLDEQKYDPSGLGNASEDYRYDQLRDGYKPRQNFYDTVEEAQLVRGMSDDAWGSFGEMLTVYGRCKINLNAVKTEHWPIMAAIVRAAAKDKNNPVLADDTMVAALSQQVKSFAQLVGGIPDTNFFAEAMKNGGIVPNMKSPFEQPGAVNSTQTQPSQNTPSLLPPVVGAGPIELNPQVLNMIATTGPREVYRLDATGTVQRNGSKQIQVHVRAIFDTKKFNQNDTSGEPGNRVGNWVYWRID